MMNNLYDRGNVILRSNYLFETQFLNTCATIITGILCIYLLAISVFVSNICTHDVLIFFIILKSTVLYKRIYVAGGLSNLAFYKIPRLRQCRLRWLCTVSIMSLLPEPLVLFITYQSTPNLGDITTCVAVLLVKCQIVYSRTTDTLRLIH